jgi:hypothetical protein
MGIVEGRAEVICSVASARAAVVTALTIDMVGGS